MGEFSLSHILIVLVIFLIFFGPSRLPQLGSSLGKAIRDFKDSLNGTNKTENTQNAATQPREQVQAPQDRTPSATSTETKETTKT